MRANIIFNDFCASRRIFAYIGIFVLCLLQDKGLVELQNVFSRRVIPKQKSGKHCGVRVPGDACETCGRTRRYTEKIHKDAFVDGCVLIRENPHRAACSQNAQHRSSRIIFFNWTIAGKAPIAVHERIYTLVFNRSCQKRKRSAIKRLREWCELPSAHVSGEKNYSIAAFSGPFKMLETFASNKVSDVFARER